MAAAEHDSEKLRRKICKKSNRLRETLLKKENISAVDFPTLILCVCNGGLGNCVAYEEMLEQFGQFGKKCDILMIPQKSYAYVCYKTIAESEEAYKQMNGHKLQSTENRPNEVVLYTFYVNEVGKSVSPSRERPPGLILLEEYVTEEYAAEIIKSVNWQDDHVKGQQGQLKHRRVKHYGYEFRYDINNVDPDEPLPEGIPDVYKPLLDKLIDSGVVKHYPDQLTINQYQPGQGIPPHVDTTTAFEDGLISLSLGSQVLMEFRHPDGRHLSVLLPPRSVLIMTGESRYVWSHGITPRKSDIVPLADGGLTLLQRELRTSFTFRKLTGVKPSQLISDKPDVPCNNSTASELEKKHVYQVYEEIADHFSGTRHTPWPNIAEFLKKQSPGSLLVDVGCGNGKYLGVNKDLFEIGSDRSYNLARIVRERKFQVYVGDILSIPLRAEVADVCICIAVIHHLSTQERRKRAICELLKVLRPGGQALIYVWAMEQEMNKVKSKYLKDNKSSNAKFDVENQSCENSKGDIVNHSQENSKCESENQSCENSKCETENQSCESSNCHTENQSHQSKEKNMNENIVSGCSNLQNNIKTGNIKTDNTDLSSDLKKLEVHVNRTQFKQQDLLVPWQLKGKEKKSESSATFHRFYHVFQKGELESLCESVKNCSIIKSYYDQGNWAVILEKI
ncbi:alkylated DNA repair protein alkB homolog 8-like isoform X2 [Ruditapes philippinarum]|uniref:alkylated DNA repair protein alkB homolog 8-like isoform X2 n=1 Tax=Ruditapes philippinarum TaxID=129788 RepID=UPI00295BE56E|nr:alkylated DNA repair protein alkB homolog 8-like isoform X2 [Ruditapes philippinarum]